MLRVLLLLSTLSLAVFGGVGCGDDGGDGGVDAAVCPPNTRCVAGEISASETWTSDQPVLLQDKVFVTSGAILTIDPGTTIQGDDGSALIIANGGQIAAIGTEDNPIVFTSSKPEGMRATGDWAGLALLGGAPINLTATGAIEGIDAADLRGQYGGSDAAADCGTLKYVRVEFAGDELTVGNELNGLTVGACGSGTEIDFLQVHRGKDDGIEFFGGTVGIKHVVISGAADDSMDWDQGFQGKGQFVIIAQLDGIGDNGFEADNKNDANIEDAEPRSQPTLFNFTMVGGGGGTKGMTLREGTWGNMQNFIVADFGEFAIDVRDGSTVAGTNQTPPTLEVGNSVFFNVGLNGNTYFPVEAGEGDDDLGFDEDNHFKNVAPNNIFDTDPEFANAAMFQFTPSGTGPAATVGATPPDDGFFDITATYRGAIDPAGPDWTANWTAYPEN